MAAELNPAPPAVVTAAEVVGTENPLESPPGIAEEEPATAAPAASIFSCKAPLAALAASSAASRSFLALSLFVSLRVITMPPTRFFNSSFRAREAGSSLIPLLSARSNLAKYFTSRRTADSANDCFFLAAASSIIFLRAAFCSAVFTGALPWPLSLAFSFFRVRGIW